MDSGIKKEILDAIKWYGSEGATSVELEGKVNLERHTLSKYLSLMEREGLVNHKEVGRGRVWFINKEPLKKLSRSEEEAMTFHERLILNLTKNIPIGIMVMDKDYTIQFANDLLVKSYGELVGTKFYASILGLRNPNSLKRVNSVIEGSLNIAEIKRTDSFDNVLNIRCSKLVNPDGTFSVIAAIEDVTDEELAEKALKESESRYRHLFENLNDAVFLADADTGLLVDANKQAEKLIGKHHDEIVGTHQRGLHPPALAGEYSQRFETHVRMGHEADYDGEVVRKDGTLIPVNISASTLYIDNKKYILGVFRDLTEKKRAEESIKHLASFPELNPNPIIEIGLEGQLTYINKAAKKLFPTLKTDGFKHPWLKDFESIVNMFKNNGKDLHMKEVKVGDSWFAQSIHYVRDSNMIRIYSLDITERKKVEQALRESQKDLNHAQAVGRMGGWRLNLQRNELLWSDETYRIFGIPRITPLTYETFLALVHPEDREYVDSKWQAALSGKPYDIEHRIIVDGKVKWVREKAELEFDKQGNLRVGFGIVQDITELREAEAERTRLNNVLETIPAYVVLLTPDYHLPFANRLFRERFGESHGRRCFEFLFKRAEPCENCETYKVLKTNEPHRWEWTGPDGRTYDIFDFPFTDADGSKLILEMGIDVTERKQAGERQKIKPMKSGDSKK